MKISELIVKLATIADTDGDLDVIHRVGEMDDPEGIRDAITINADIQTFGGATTYYHIPYDNENAITNAKAVELS